MIKPRILLAATLLSGGLAAQNVPLPSVLHICFGGCEAGKGGTVVLRNDRYVTSGSSGEDGYFEVETLTRQTVVIHRTELGAYHGNAVLTGQLSPEGNRVVNGKIHWTYHPCCGFSSGTFQAAWGAAINTVPGTDNGSPRLISDPPPAKLPPPKPFASPESIDLSGIWQQDAGIPNRLDFPRLKISLTQVGRNLMGINLEAVPFLSRGGVILQRRNPEKPTEISMRTFRISGPVVWVASSLTVDGPDHISIAETVLSARADFTRVARNQTPGEIACDPENSHHVSGVEALGRFWIYYGFVKDLPVAVCWAHAGAVQGDVDAQQAYGAHLLKGEGVPKNPAEAFPWLQKSAMMGSYYAAIDLSEMFDKGLGVPASLHRSLYWNNRAAWNDPAFVHTNTFLRVTQWAADTAGPCDPANSAHLDSNTIWRSGRVAFQARAGEDAVCWYQQSSALGNRRADVYLGVIYMFGIGVRRDQQRGLDYIRKASAAKDPFGMMYLANVYQYGLAGVKPDFAKMSELRSAVNRDPQGSDVVIRVQGIRGGILDIFSPAFNPNDHCESLRDIAKDSPTVDHIYDAEHCQPGLESGIAPAQHTVNHPEEIFPEVFDPITLVTDDIRKKNALEGATRVTP